MLTLPPSATLLIIDVQQFFNDAQWGERNNPDAEERIAQLLQGWRAAGRPIIHVQHGPSDPGAPLHPGADFKPQARPRPGEPIIRKQVNSAFIGTDLEARLRSNGVDTLVVAGLTTDHCVSTTVRMAGNLGFRVVLLEDATATFAKVGPDGRAYTAQALHDVHLASLHREFAHVTRTAEVLRALQAATPATA